MRKTALITIIFSLILTQLAINYLPAKTENANPLETNSIPNPTIYSSLKQYENQSFLTHNMEVRISQENSLKITSTFLLSNNDTNPLYYFVLEINQSISTVFVYDPIGALAFTWIVNPTFNNIINITLRYPIDHADTYLFSVSYEMNNIIYYVQEPVEYSELDLEITHPRNSDYFNLEVILPFDNFLIDETSPPPLIPTANQIYEEDNRIYIVWNFESKDAGDTDLFIIRFNTLTSICPSEPNLLALYIVISIIGGILIGGLGFFGFYRWKLKPTETELVSSLLTENEQEVIKAINKDGGVSTQRRICDKTGFSKSKVSQILKKLEEKDVLKRERWGRTNKVTIIKQSFKELKEEKETSKVD